MSVYIATFILSSLLVQAAASPRITSRVARILASALPIVITSIVAGARDFTVGGPDALAYGNNLFIGATSATSYESLDNYALSLSISREPGYVAVNWVASWITSDPHVFYFLLSAFVSSIVLAAIMLMRDYGPVGLMWLTFLCTAYVDTFNLLRQAPALALGLLGIVLVIRQRRWLGLAVGACGLLFHASAFAFLAMWVVAVILQTAKGGRSTRRVVFVIAGTVAVVFASSYLMDIAGVLIGDGKYASYLQDSARGGSALGLDVFYRVIPILAGLYALAKLKPKPIGTTDRFPMVGQQSRVQLLTKPVTAPAPPGVDVQTRRTALTVLLVLLVIELLLIPLREISYPLYRVPMYFGYVRIIAYAVIVGSLRVHRIPGGLALIGFVAAYFVLVVLMRNDGYYTSEVLTEWFRP